MNSFSKQMYRWMVDLFPIHRSIMGPGFKNSLNYLKKINPDMKFLDFPSGKKVFDWVIPEEWHIFNSYISDKNGKKHAEFKKNNLHIVSHSIPVNKIINRKNLFKKIHIDSSSDIAIPYITSFYEKNWGFCMSKKQKNALKGNEFKVLIDSKFVKGHLRIGEIFIKGRKKNEIFFSTYLCHPSLANNELSGPVVQSALIKKIKKKYKKTNFSYRFIFIPETIGSITYLNKNLKLLKKNIHAGFNITCVGDNRNYTIVKSRAGNSIADEALTSSIFDKKSYKEFDFTEKGSDERQYCAPGIDLPVATFCRTKFGNYPEYHTSLDNLKLVSPKSLGESLEILENIIEGFETYYYPKTKILGEPFLTKYKLYQTLSIKSDYIKIKNLLNAISYADGKSNIFKISIKSKIPLKELINIYKILREKKIIY